MKQKQWKKKIETVGYFGGGMLAICLLLLFPFLYFQYADATQYDTEHSMEKIAFSLDTDVQNIKMVKALHRMLNSPYQTKNGALAQEGAYEEIHVVAKDTSTLEMAIREHEGGSLHLLYDKETGMVVEAKYSSQTYQQKKWRQKLCTRQGDRQLEQELREFIQYLGLDIVGDWEYTPLFGQFDTDDVRTWEQAERQMKENAIQYWMMSSHKAGLDLMAVPEKDGMRYYFQVGGNW